MTNGLKSEWSAGGLDKENPRIQVELESEFIIKAVSIQGRGNFNQYI